MPLWGFGSWNTLAAWGQEVQSTMSYPEPDQFDPERFSPDREGTASQFTYIPFGAGPRMCVGNHFTYTLVTMALASIAQRFRFSLIDDPTSIEPDPSLALRPKFGINVRLSNA